MMGGNFGLKSSSLLRPGVGDDDVNGDMLVLVIFIQYELIIPRCLEAHDSSSSEEEAAY
jgi:hypothetical protein